MPDTVGSAAALAELSAGKFHLNLHSHFTSLDYLVGDRRDFEAECLRGLKVDDKLISGRELYRQIGRLRRQHSPPDIDLRYPVRRKSVRQRP